MFPLCVFICRVLTWEELPSASHPVLGAPASSLGYLVIVVRAEFTALGQALARALHLCASGRHWQPSRWLVSVRMLLQQIALLRQR